jgi:CRP-like cAMP-binding protein
MAKALSRPASPACERDKGFYVITKGSATVTAGGVERARLFSGAHFGEVAVIDGGPRTATVTADTRHHPRAHPGRAAELLDKEPSIANAMAERLSLLVPDSGASEARPVDRRSLEELCRRFREAQHPEWAQPEVPRRSAWRRLLGSSG